MLVIKETGQKKYTAITMRDALYIGFAQVFALIPGVSRSGSTVLMGMFLGYNKKESTEYSFFVAIPLLIGITLKQLLNFQGGQFYSFLNEYGILMIISFLSGWISLRWLLNYVATKTFRIFGLYRILLGIIILITLIV